MVRRDPGASHRGLSTMGVKFGLLGAAGYIAERHMRAIRDVGGEIVAAYDPCDSVGILDSYFDECSFATKSGEFWKACQDRGADWISICTPNYIHSLQAMEAMQAGYNVICEKPLCIREECLDSIASIEDHTGKRTFAIQQLRLHPHMVQLKNMVQEGEWYSIILEYITRRGPWYWKSWKSKPEQSGGLLMNIGVHFFDVLQWIFGEACHWKLYTAKDGTCSGMLHLGPNRSIAGWKLSIDKSELPSDTKPTWRKMIVHAETKQLFECDFSAGFEDLHTESYRKILAGEGYGVKDVAPSIKLVRRLMEET